MGWDKFSVCHTNLELEYYLYLMEDSLFDCMPRYHPDILPLLLIHYIHHIHRIQQLNHTNYHSQRDQVDHNHTPNRYYHRSHRHHLENIHIRRRILQVVAPPRGSRPKQFPLQTLQSSIAALLPKHSPQSSRSFST